MKSLVLALVVIGLGSLTSHAYAQRGGGSMAGGCQRGGATMVPPSTGVPTLITSLPTEGSMALATVPEMASLAGFGYRRQSYPYWQRMQQAYLAGQMAQAVKQEQEAAAAKEQERKRKLELREKRREEELAKRATAKEKARERKLADKSDKSDTK